MIPSQESGINDKELMTLAAYGEALSNHPIALSVLNHYKEISGGAEIDGKLVSDAKEIPGHGITALYMGKELLVGNHKLMDLNDISFTEAESAGTVVYVAYDKKFMGSVIISDVIKEGVKEAISGLKSAGVNKSIMLTGDRKKTALSVASEIGIDETYYELLPADKVDRVEKLLLAEDNGRKLAFIGDGINDAPVLMRADVGIAMGSLGSDAAIEAADIVIMDDDIRKIPLVIRIARKTTRIVKENIVFALLVKMIILILGALGLTTMWLAVFGDVGVAVIAILNSMRALKIDR